MAFLKNRTSAYIVGVLIILALLGLYGSFTADPAAFLQKIAVFVLIGLVIYFVVRKFSNSSPQKKEQRAFLKAARRSKKRLQHRSGETNVKGSTLGTLTTLKKGKAKKKSPAHLTVIDGKKGKKKNRASF
ncbi:MULTISPECIES: SA1362 family protein [Neobacillus]|uniref:SA1362 family protein n=1 Tax=Neobacillus TaxID=2675232 RepID=UPI0030B83598